MFYIIYLIGLIILLVGLFIMLTSDNLIRKIIGLVFFQNAVLIFYIALGKTENSIVPLLQASVLSDDVEQISSFVFSNPLPHVLMLTAIVVGFATTSVALTLAYKIYREFKTVSEREIRDQMMNTDG